MFPIILALDKHVGHFGATHVLAGADKAMQPLANASTAFCRQMRERWWDGEVREVPIGPGGRLEPRLVRIVCIGIEGDNLGIAKLLPMTKGWTAHKYCRDCYHDTRNPDAVAAFRDTDTLCTECQHVATLRSKTAVKAYFHQTGVQEVSFPLHPTLLPGCDPIAMTTPDFMHDEAGGTIPHEAGENIRGWIRAGYFTWADLVGQLASLKRKNPTCTIPELRPAVLKPGKTLRMKSAHAHDLVRYSDELFLPLLGAAAATDPAWQAWCAHCKYALFMLRDEFSQSDVRKLDKLIKKHRRLYRLVPGAHELPKHHLVEHYPQSIRRAGPIRVRWGYSLEGYNRRVTQWGRRSGYKNVVKHIAINLSLEQGWDLQFS